MIAMGLQVEMSMPPGIGRRLFDQAVRHGYETVAWHWHEKHLPRHFGDTAYQRYGYKRRSSAYQKRKRNKYGHQRPLVWTGHLERQAKSKRNTIVRVDRRKVVVRFARGVQALNLSGRTGRTVRVTGPNGVVTTRVIGDMPDMRRELATVSAEETAELSKVFTDAVAEFLNRKRPLRKVVG